MAHSAYSSFILKSADTNLFKKKNICKTNVKVLYKHYLFNNTELRNKKYQLLHNERLKYYLCLAYIAVTYNLYKTNNTSANAALSTYFCTGGHQKRNYKARPLQTIAKHSS